MSVVEANGSVYGLCAGDGKVGNFLLRFQSQHFAYADRRRNGKVWTHMRSSILAFLF